MFKWKKSSQSSPKLDPTKEDVLQQSLGSLQEALGGGNPIYVILKEYVDQKASLEGKCAALHEGISDLLLKSELKEQLKPDMFRIVQSTKTQLDSLNFQYTKDKKRENIYSGYLLRQQLEQFFSQSPDVQVFSRNTQILLATLQNFLKEFLIKEENNREKNDQLIKSMTALINFVAKNNREKLTSFNFPSYAQYKNPNATTVLPSFQEILAEIKMNINDSDIGQLFDPVNKLSVDDDVKFQILRGLLSCLEDQPCEETYSAFIDLLLGSDNAEDAISKIKKMKEDLENVVRGLHQQFNTIVQTIDSNLSDVKMNLGVVSGYNNKFEKLNGRFETLKYEKGVMDKKVSNGTSKESMMQLSEEQREMNDIDLKALELSKDVETVLTEVLDKVKKRNEQLREIMQMDLDGKVKQLKEFDAELENLSQQADIGELGKQIEELLADTVHIKYLKSDEELLKMGCDDVNSDISSLQKFNANFEKVEQSIIKIREAIEHKQELEQIIQQTECLYDQTKSLLEKLEKIQQEFVIFICSKLQQVKERLVVYQTGTTKLRKPGGAEEKVDCLSNEICKIHEQKIGALDQSLKKVESLYETSGQLFVSITKFGEMINLLNSNHSDSSIDERFTKFWSIEIEKLTRIQEYLQILNIDSEKLNSFISQLSAVENWLNDNKSFVDSNVDSNSDEIYINAIQTGKGVTNQTKEHMNSMKKFLKEAIERIKQRIDDMQREYDRRLDEINKVQLVQRGTHVCINDRSNRLKKMLCAKFQTLKKQTEGKDPSIKDGQFFNDIAELFTEETEHLFDEWVKDIDRKIKESNGATTYNPEVASIVSNFVNDNAENVEEYRDLVRSYEETEQQLKDLLTELYVIDVQKEQPKEILRILRENLSDIIDFDDCERFLQDHAQAFMTSLSRHRPNPPPEEECDKTSKCSLL
ncbi:MAG: hypothetical protein AMJ43_03280 [Coxiella sp. DG_40]|nr:MAG: hypothetical protein AMJ43_03280 [Coxiella sp. DG_40]